eukprot:5442937-Pleurochrysis_carterae.AAC.1
MSTSTHENETSSRLHISQRQPLPSTLVDPSRNRFPSAAGYCVVCPQAKAWRKLRAREEALEQSSDAAKKDGQSGAAVTHAVRGGGGGGGGGGGIGG